MPLAVSKAAREILLLISAGAKMAMLLKTNQALRLRHGYSLALHYEMGALFLGTKISFECHMHTCTKTVDLVGRTFYVQDAIDSALFILGSALF